MLQKAKFIPVTILFLVLLPLAVKADYLGQKINFFVESSYDLNKREQVSATLQRITPQLYFYFDDSWWNSLESQKKLDIDKVIDSLSSEFQSKIYPTLTSTFGFEWKPGIDKDERITVLLHPMIKEGGGYFQSGNEYPRLQVPRSNEREMLYLNADYVTDPLFKSFLSHEFLHLITFSQKEKIQGTVEEVWLNEARAEYASTLLGYDDQYQGSNLQRRVNIFLEEPTDSITEWKNEKADYGALNLFTQYLVDHYGVKILTDSLKSKETGIKSLNEALVKNGFSENFSQIFVDWTIAVVVNDCDLAPLDSEHLTGVGEKYCYLNKNLNNLRITPMVNFLPVIGESTLSVSSDTKDWAGNWYRFVGGKGSLKLTFTGSSWVKFKVPYLIRDIQGNYKVNFITLNENQKGEISILDFGTENIFLTIIPSVQNKISGFSSDEPSYSFFWSASVIKNTQEEKEKAELELVKKLQEQVVSLQKQIAEVQAKINAILASRGQKITCSTFERDLYFGMRNNPEVQCLQEFLKSQGSEIYPEGLVTGNFLNATQSAVIRFQEKYKEEILVPLSLNAGTGYVGLKTRAKINQLLP